MKILEIENFLKEIKPRYTEGEGFLFGDPEQELKGVLVCWMATIEAIKKAIKKGCNLLLCHEDPFFPGDLLQIKDEKHLLWDINQKKIKLFKENGIVVYRSHCYLDELVVTDTFTHILGLPEASVKDWIGRVHVIREVTLEELAKRIKKRMRLRYVRIIGDPSHKVRRVGIAVGGMGLSINLPFWEDLRKYHPEVIITGELDEYAMRYAIDTGIDVIETSHSASENPGLRKFAQYLREKLPHLKIIFYRCPLPYNYV